MDEAGNTGENLLHAAQPIYALAAVRVSDDARQAITVASIAFRQDISAADAHHLTRLADRLSFRQLQCLALFARPESELRKPDSELLPIGTGSSESVMRIRGALGHELMDLGNQGLYGQIDQATGEVETVIGASLRRGAKFNPGLTELGRLLFETMRLDLIPEQELKDARDDLRSRPTSRVKSPGRSSAGVGCYAAITSSASTVAGCAA